MRTINLFLFSALLFFACTNVLAQVTIGGLTKPASGALLDLNSTNRGGLVLSNVTITDLEKIPFGNNVFSGVTAADADENIALRGIMVYNDGHRTAVPAGIYVWNGYCWAKDGNCGIAITYSSSSPVSIMAGSTKTLSVGVCGCFAAQYQWYEGLDVNNGTLIPNATAKNYTTPDTLAEKTTHYYYCKVSSYSGPDGTTLSEITSDVFTVNVKENLAKLTPVRGDFFGKTCFDIANANGEPGNNCGTLSDRTGRKATFSNRTPQESTVASNYSGVQIYTFAPTSTVSHVRFYYTEPTGISIIDSIVPMSSTYEAGNSIRSSCKVTVYYRTSLDNDLKNYSRSNTPYKLKLYAVYNSDANYSTPANDKVLELKIALHDCSCCGAYTNKSANTWLDFMCHNLGADESYDPLIPAAAIHGAKYQFGQKNAALSMADDQRNPNEVAGWNPRVTPTSGNWPSGNNPCPSGWRLPTNDEWNNINDRSNNDWTAVGEWRSRETNFSSGYTVGDALFLPAAGYRASIDGYQYERGFAGEYWSSTGDGTHGGRLNFVSYEWSMNGKERAYGLSVRCVAQ
jgi:uncharacterized protein (TIGR02145 family)